MRKALISHLEAYITDRRKETFKRTLSERTKFFTIVLENLYQPHNASAVLRSCECLGIQDVYIIENKNTFSPNKDICNGADQWIDTHVYSGEGATQACLHKLEEKGYTLCATSPHEKGTSLFDIPVNRKYAFIFGEEKSGVSTEIKKRIKHFVNIPMYGMTESFNISVAVSLALHYLGYTLRNNVDKKDWKLTDEEKEEIYERWLKKSVRNSEDIVRNFLKYQT